MAHDYCFVQIVHRYWDNTPDDDVSKTNQRHVELNISNSPVYIESSQEQKILILDFKTFFIAPWLNYSFKYTTYTRSRAKGYIGFL